MREETEVSRQPNFHAPELFVAAYGGRKPEAYAAVLADVIRYGVCGPIVDLGCGLGLLVELAHGWGLTAIGLEGSEYAVEQARTRTHGELDIRVHDLGDQLPFADGSIANVMLNQVIEHIDSARCSALLTECFRVLAPGGVAFINSPSRLNLRERREPTHINMLLPSELRAMLETAGFRVVRQPDYGFWFDPGGFRILNALSDLAMRVLPHDWCSATANAVAAKS